jgi:glucokinase
MTPVLNANASAPIVLGVDLGGTKLAVGLVDSTGRLLHADRAPTLSHEGPARIVQRLIELCRRVMEVGAPAGNIAAIGIGCAGQIDSGAGIVRNPANIPNWGEVPLVSLLSDALGAPGYIENDANAAALGEHRFGAGRGARNMVYMTISTGVGGGVIIDDKLYRGENGNAAELGHITVDYRGRRCPCGCIGCLELYASGSAIAAEARALIQGGLSSSMTAAAGSVDVITGRHVVEALRQGDAVARQVWDGVLPILGAGVVSVIHAFNPSRIVIGGGIAQAGELLFAPLRDYVARHTIPIMARVVELVEARLADQGGIYGAAAVAIQNC